MTDALTPERLAELRDTYERGTGDTVECLLELIAIGSSDWQEKPRHRANWVESLTAYQDEHVALLGEVDRLTAELAETRKHARIAVAQSVRLATGFADIPARLDELANALAVHHRQRQIAIRAMADVVRHRLGSDRDYALADWSVAPRDARDGPQPHAERPAAGFAATETPEVFRAPRWPADGVLPGSLEDVLALATPQAVRATYEAMAQRRAATEEPDAIAPEDEGISTADAPAQAASDAEDDPRVFVAALGKCRDPQCPVCVGVLKRTHTESE